MTVGEFKARFSAVLDAVSKVRLSRSPSAGNVRRWPFCNHRLPQSAHGSGPLDCSRESSKSGSRKIGKFQMKTSSVHNSQRSVSHWALKKQAFPSPRPSLKKHENG